MRPFERKASTLPGSGRLPRAYVPAAFSHHCQALPVTAMPESLRAKGTQEMPPPRAWLRPLNAVLAFVATGDDRLAPVWPGCTDGWTEGVASGVGDACAKCAVGGLLNDRIDPKIKIAAPVPGARIAT